VKSTLNKTVPKMPS